MAGESLQKLRDPRGLKRSLISGKKAWNTTALCIWFVSSPAVPWGSGSPAQGCLPALGCSRSLRPRFPVPTEGSQLIPAQYTFSCPVPYCPTSLSYCKAFRRLASFLGRLFFFFFLHGKGNNRV